MSGKPSGLPSTASGSLRLGRLVNCTGSAKPVLCGHQARPSHKHLDQQADMHMEPSAKGTSGSPPLLHEPQDLD